MRHHPILTAAIITAVSLPVASSLIGCDSRIGQCNRLIEVINGEQQHIKDAAKNTDAAGMKKLADTLDGVAGKVNSVELKDDKLVGFRNDYKGMVEDLSKVARDSAAAIESQDPNKAQEAKKKMNSFSTRENDLVNSINKYCSGG